MGLLAPYNGLDVMRLAECGLRDRLMLVVIPWVLTSLRTEVESGKAEVLCLEEQVHAAEEESEAFQVPQNALMS